MDRFDDIPRAAFQSGFLRVGMALAALMTPGPVPRARPAAHVRRPGRRGTSAASPGSTQATTRRKDVPWS